jgi:hypothetical protein
MHRNEPRAEGVGDMSEELSQQEADSIAKEVKEMHRQFARAQRAIDAALSVALPDKEEEEAANKLFRDLEALTNDSQELRNFPTANTALFVASVAAMHHAKTVLQAYFEAWNKEVIEAKFGAGSAIAN